MERISWEDRDEISEKIGDEELDAQLEEDREMIRELTPPLDDEKLKKGEMTSVYFGSAMGDQVEPFWTSSSTWGRGRRRGRCAMMRRLSRPMMNSRVLCSRCRPSWTPNIGTAWPM